MRVVISWLSWLTLVAISLAGCLDVGPPCGDGRCPLDTVCDQEHARCLYPEQRTVCQGILDGAPCVVAGIGDGVCSDQVCVRVGCGDGVVSGLEECDGADLGKATTCVDLGRGYRPGGALRCQADCTYDTSSCGARCGDGAIQDGETCDGAALGGQTCIGLGFYDGRVGCKPDCTLDVSACVGTCGDGARTAGEACDGTDFGTLTCTSLGYYGGSLGCGGSCGVVDTSHCVGTCGDHVKNGPEICDDQDLPILSCQAYGWYTGTLSCQADCISVDKSACAGYCGDGAISGPERCDGLRQERQSCRSLGARGGLLGCDAFCMGPTTDSCVWHKWHDVGPAGSDGLLAVWASGHDDVWVGGEWGALLHFDGDRWTPYPTANQSHFRDVWGTARDDVWAVGQTADIYHFDGRQWSATESPGAREMVAIRGSARDDVWALTWSQDPLIHYDGLGWTPVEDSPTWAEHLWVNARDDVWVFGDTSATDTRGAHFDGHAWTTFSLPNRQVSTVWGTARDDVWVGTWAGELVHFDGEAWTTQASPGNTIQSLFGSARDDVWAITSGAILHHDGRTWSQVQVQGERRLTAGWSVGPDQAWAVGERGTVQRTDGVGWRPFDAGGSDPYFDLAMLADGTGYALAYPAGLSYFDGAAWTGSELPFDVNALWAAARDDVWAVGRFGGAYHYDGETWTPAQAAEVLDLRDVWGTGPDDIWAAGMGFAGEVVFVHYDGQTWTPTVLAESAMLWELWGSGPRDIWAVGNVVSTGASAIYHYDGATWALSPTGADADQTLYGIWGSGPGDVWAVGAGGLILHHDGTAWTRVEAGTTGLLTSVWGSGPGDVWVVGDGGIVLHDDGGAWSSYDLATTTTLLRVRGAGPDDVWIAKLDGLAHLGARMPGRDGGVCAAPIDLRCGATVYGRVDARAAPAAHHCGRDQGREVVYRLDSPVAGHVALTLRGHGGDVDLAVLGSDDHRGCAPGSCLAVGQQDGDEQVQVTTRTADTIYVTVDAAAGSDVAYTLQVACAKD